MVQENVLVATTHEPARTGGSGGRGGSGSYAAGFGEAEPSCGEAEPTALLAWAGVHATAASSTPATQARPLADPPDLGVSCRILVPHPPSCVTIWPGRKKGRPHGSRHSARIAAVTQNASKR